MQIIGRDQLLSKEVLPRVRSSRGAYITGQRGIGKTAILEWAHEHAKGDKILLSAKLQHSEMLRLLTRHFDISTKGLSQPDTESRIIQEAANRPGLWIFLDDLESATPKKCSFLILLLPYIILWCAGNAPIREHQKRMLWGRAEIKVGSIAQKYRLALALEIIKSTGARISPAELAHASFGVPGRAWAIARGELPRREAQHVEGEEINLLPLALIGLGGIMALRAIGAGLGQTDLYLMGGVGAGLGVAARYWLYRSMRK